MTEQDDPGGKPPSITVDDEVNSIVEPATIAAWATRTLQLLGVPEDAALFVSLVSPERIAELKRDALGVHAPTDVLSFPMDDPGDPSPGPVVLGDLVLCPEVASSQARALGRSPEDEVRELIVHGILHLLGRDHADVVSELAMAREQRALVHDLEGAA